MIFHRSAVGVAPCAVLMALLASGCAVQPIELAPMELSEIADDKLSRVTADQEPLSSTVDLYEAIARALKYNLDHQVEMAEQAVRERELSLAHYSMLPTAVAGSGYAGRDSFSASSSQNVLTGAESLATSTSQDKRLKTADIAFSWNVLDFGLSYVKARQSADRVLIQNELRRKVTLRIIENVRSAYWRALSAQRLLGRLSDVEDMARSVERESSKLGKDGETSQITALTYQREVVEIQRTIAEVQRELSSARAELASLMNVSPDTTYRVKPMPRVVPPLPSENMGGLLHMAVMNRPELREVEYRKRINFDEADAALLELLPGVQLLAGENFDSNSFLFANHWQNWGAKASWNLIKVFSYPAKRDVIEEQGEMLDKRSLAVTMAIMTQVYVSRIRYAHAVKEHKIAKRYRNVQADLLEQIRSEFQAGRIARQTLVREELNAVVAEARLDIQYATVQSSFANIQASIGVEPFVGVAGPEISVATLADALRSSKAPVRLVDLEEQHDWKVATHQ